MNFDETKKVRILDQLDFITLNVFNLKSIARSFLHNFFLLYKNNII